MASILLVEDDLLICRMMAMRLGRHGHETTLAHNGRDGMDLALSQDFDLVLMDMHMPVMDGHEAVRQLRAQGYSGTIVAVTASAMSQDSQAAIDAGCDHFIAKPIAADFEDRVAEILAKAHQVAPCS